jgi:hypothetical protein
LRPDFGSTNSPETLEFADDLSRLFFARRSGLREGGKSVPTFRDHALDDRFHETNQIESIDFNYGPHPEEARSAVSKDGSAARFRLWPSFETPAARAPQDEVDMIRTSETIV